MQKKYLIARKPAYRHGQLLLEDDFIDEQAFHADARYRHAARMHGFGVVHGLEVTPAGEAAVSISPGYAVDRRGHEIELGEAQTLELHGLPPGSLAWVTIGYRTEHGEGASDRRIDCYAMLRVATGVETHDVRLASVQLDDRGRLAHEAIGDRERDRLGGVIAPGSVTAESLSAQLRSDWVSLAFHPSAIPRDEDDSQPPFRIGATETRAHREINGQPNTRGAAGTMAIALPPGIRHLRRLRVAGAENEKKLFVRLFKGGFDPNPKVMKHLRDEVVSLEIGPGPYCETVEIPEPHRSMANRHRTLAIDLRSEGFVRVSLVAVEVSY
jgi:hypothetical protein